jgi:aldehyde:ferredoxin oxidoreductase
MMYASESRDPTIGSHQSVLLLADLVRADREAARRQFRTLSQKVWGDADALEPTFENKAPVAIWGQNQHMLIDSLPMCDFAFPQVIRPMPGPDLWKTTPDLCGDLDLDRRLLVAVTGIEFSREDLTRVAERAFTLERMMLARAGRGRALEQSLAPHFKLPCRSDGTLIDGAGFARLLDEYYTARGWDLRFGWPEADALQALGLGQHIQEMEERRRQAGLAQGERSP